MGKLSEQQEQVIALGGDVFVTACPGSGKTRVLTEKIGIALAEPLSPQKRIAAVTFTNRAAEEIRERLGDMGVSRRQLWTGTIHSFALEWILRPYASYDDQLRHGFAIADEGMRRKLIESLKSKHGVAYTADLRLGYYRDGSLMANGLNERALIEEVRETLRAMRLLDFDSMLLVAFSLLNRRPEIAQTLGAIFSLICVDEYQDTQDLQFGILSSIVRGSRERCRLFMVGDKNQAIYSSLGGLAKSVEEVRTEFGRPSIHHRELSGNYRSTQRIVDFCSNLCDESDEKVVALAEYAGEMGLITFADQSVHADDLAGDIARVVRFHLDAGVRPEEICILGPTWWLLTAFGRQLVLGLPDVDIDAPGLSPLRYQPDSVWFKLARLFLTEPTPARYRSRLHWATDFVSALEGCLGRELPEQVRTARAILRLVNDLSSVEESGLAYLDDVFEQFFTALELDLRLHPSLIESRQSFFDSAEERLIDKGSELETVENLRKMFRYPTGVVVNSCHGAKGEEFAVVICFGLLRGYIPHWNRIFDDDCDDFAESRRILYVVASRAKRNLHLFSENGRKTNSGRAYETTHELSQVKWEYDEIP